MRNRPNWVKRKGWWLACIMLVAALLGISGIQVVDRVDVSHGQVGIATGWDEQKVLTLGHVAYASGDVDYTYDGVDDDVQFQAALDALPATGGRLVDVSAVQKNFSATVTRAIPNVTITGSGAGSYFTNDGGTTIFSVGGNGWHFENLRTDAGGIDVGATYYGGLWTNVTIGTTRYTYKPIAPSQIYVYGDATGANDGTSWTNAFTTIQAAWDSLPSIVENDVVITVRSATNPYREEVKIYGKILLPGDIYGSPHYPDVFGFDFGYERVTIEGEHYVYGDCEANVGGAGEITDTGAFGDVAIGDHVFVIDLNGADGRCQDYEVGTVDDVSNAPNRIGTTLATTPSANWKYAVCRTEISGSDDGTVPGMARDYAFYLSGITNVSIKGFHITLTDFWAIQAHRSNGITIFGCMFEDCDRGIWAQTGSEISMSYISVDTSGGTEKGHCLGTFSTSLIYCYYGGFRGRIDAEGGSGAVLASDISRTMVQYGYIERGKFGVQGDDFALVNLYYSTIDAGCETGVLGNGNSEITTYYCTNSSGTPSSLTQDAQYWIVSP